MLESIQPILLMADELNPACLTAAEYYAAKERAKHSHLYKRELRKKLEVLKNYPEAEERLLFELLASTLETLRAGESPRGSLLDALQFESSVTLARNSDFLSTLEEIVRLSFNLLGRTSVQTGDYLALKLSTKVGLVALRKKDHGRFSNVYRQLRSRLDPTIQDHRATVLDSIGNT